MGLVVGSGGETALCSTFIQLLGGLGMVASVHDKMKSSYLSAFVVLSLLKMFF